MTQVLALTEHINAGVRRHEDERFEMPDDRVSALRASGLVMPETELSAPWPEESGRVLSPLGYNLYHSARIQQDAIRSLQLAFYDPGCAAYRYHSAFNTSRVLASRFARHGHSNTASDLRQLDGETQKLDVEVAFRTANVIHCHIDFRPLYHWLGRLPEHNQLLVHHYHGSLLPGDTSRVLVDNDLDAKHDAIQIGARLYHKRFSPNMHWLPIPMPVQDYAMLRFQRYQYTGSTFRVAHSPTVRAIKGTDNFLSVIADLQAEGHKIEAVLIENMEHGEALRLKATCDATFDSFWLGLQGSGLEAACMNQLVLAGDPSAKQDYERELGSCPYTYVEDRDALKEALKRAMMDPVWCVEETIRVYDYVRAYHDYPVVAARYSDILTAALAARE